MHTSQPVIGPVLIVVCVVMVAGAALVYRIAALGSAWTVPGAALRAVAQLAAVAGVLAAAMSRLWSSVLVLAVMFIVAAGTAARRSQAQRGSWWLAETDPTRLLFATRQSEAQHRLSHGSNPFTDQRLL